MKKWNSKYENFKFLFFFQLAFDIIYAVMRLQTERNGQNIEGSRTGLWLENRFR